MQSFENKVLRTIYKDRQDKDSRGLRPRHNDELYNMYDKPGLIQILNSLWLRWTLYVNRIG